MPSGREVKRVGIGRQGSTRTSSQEPHTGSTRTSSQEPLLPIVPTEKGGEQTFPGYQQPATGFRTFKTDLFRTFSSSTEDARQHGPSCEYLSRIPPTHQPKITRADSTGILASSGSKGNPPTRSSPRQIFMDTDKRAHITAEAIVKGGVMAVQPSRMTANKMGETKGLTNVDHSTIEYASFRKSFYSEVPELARLTQSEVDALRWELEGIKVNGKGCPKPIQKWVQAGLSRKEMDILRKQGFESPTPIQAQAIPAIMSGRDLVGVARKGSGKTLAFLLPMFRHILDQPPLQEADGPVAILMAPTREACIMIGKEARKFCESLGLRVVCIYGGTGISEQIAELKSGAEIIICTPDRMIDMLAANSGRVTNLRRCTYIVLDEADRMFDMGFEPQVMRIVENVRPDRQTVMFSATFSRQMEGLARRILRKPVTVKVIGRSVVCKEVEHHVIVIDEEQKFRKLLELLGIYQEQGSVIVFVDKQETADILSRDLLKVGYSCLSLHSGIDQYDRDSTISDFKSGKVKLLIATSVAARGLDVKNLILVVNFDCFDYEDYIDRCGRTRRTENEGFAYTFVTPELERYVGEIIRAMELSGAEVEPELAKLWKAYKDKQEAERKKFKGGGGFSRTKRFKFDEAESQMVTEKRKFQKHALGKFGSSRVAGSNSVNPPLLSRPELHDSDDEDIEDDLDLESTNLPLQKYEEEHEINDFPQQARWRITSKETLAQIGDYSEAGITVRGTFVPTGKAAPEGERKLYLAIESMSELAVGKAKNEICRILKEEMLRIKTSSTQAKRLASKIRLEKNTGTGTKAEITTEAIIKGGVMAVQPRMTVTAKNMAEHLANKLNLKLNYQPPEESGGAGDPSTPFSIQATDPPVQKKYVEEDEFNDFPQQTRWRIRSKQTLVKIGDSSKAGISVRGTLVPTGKTALEGVYQSGPTTQATFDAPTAKRVSTFEKGSREGPELPEQKIQKGFRLFGKNKIYPAPVPYAPGDDPDTGIRIPWTKGPRQHNIVVVGPRGSGKTQISMKLTARGLLKSTPPPANTTTNYQRVGRTWDLRVTEVATWDNPRPVFVKAHTVIFALKLPENKDLMPAVEKLGGLIGNPLLQNTTILVVGYEADLVLDRLLEASAMLAPNLGLEEIQGQKDRLLRVTLSTGESGPEIRRSTLRNLKGSLEKIQTALLPHYDQVNQANKERLRRLTEYAGCIDEEKNEVEFVASQDQNRRSIASGTMSETESRSQDQVASGCFGRLRASMRGFWDKCCPIYEAPSPVVSFYSLFDPDPEPSLSLTWWDNSRFEFEGEPGPTSHHINWEKHLYQFSYAHPTRQPADGPRRLARSVSEYDYDYEPYYAKLY